MGGRTANYLRRDDGVLELLAPASRTQEALRGLEVALVVVALTVGAAAAVANNLVLASVLLGAVPILLVGIVVRRRRARRAARIQIRPVLPASDDPVGLRVIRFDEHAPAGARVPGTAVRLPGTAASPQE